MLQCRQVFAGKAAMGNNHDPDQAPCPWFRDFCATLRFPSDNRYRPAVLCKGVCLRSCPGQSPVLPPSAPGWPVIRVGRSADLAGVRRGHVPAFPAILPFHTSAGPSLRYCRRAEGKCLESTLNNRGIDRSRRTNRRGSGSLRTSSRPRSTAAASGTSSSGMARKTPTPRASTKPRISGGQEAMSVSPRLLTIVQSSATSRAPAAIRSSASADLPTPEGPMISRPRPPKATVVAWSLTWRLFTLVPFQTDRLSCDGCQPDGKCR